MRERLRDSRGDLRNTLGHRRARCQSGELTGVQGGMERFAGTVISVAPTDDEGRHRVTIGVVPLESTAQVESGAGRVYTLLLDPEGQSVEPEDDLADCFDAYHEHEYDDGLNPTLRRQWKTARIADEIASRIFQSGVLGLVRSDEPES